jgi:glycosyltransferase involved in cell wall biosynthesis
MRKDVADLLPALDIAVLASRTEALPMVILEYMASARPVVATEVGSVREVVDDGVTGILIPPDDAISMAQAIQRLVQHADDSRRMGEAGRLRVEQMFRLEQTVESTERLLEELVSVRRSQS